MLEWQQHLVTEHKPKIGRLCAVKLSAQILFKSRSILDTNHRGCGKRNKTKLLSLSWIVSVLTVHVWFLKGFKSADGPSPCYWALSWMMLWRNKLNKCCNDAQIYTSWVMLNIHLSTGNKFCGAGGFSWVLIYSQVASSGIPWCGLWGQWWYISVNPSQIAFMKVWCLCSMGRKLFQGR